MVPLPDPPFGPLSPGELLARYLGGQAEAIGAGLHLDDLSSEVLPYDAGAVQPVDPRIAWEEALAALAIGNGRDLNRLPIFPEWRALVAVQEPALDLAFCVGNFPQMVRNLNRLLEEKPGESHTPTGRLFSGPGLEGWVEKVSRQPWPQPLLGVGLLRLARDFDGATALLRRKAPVPAEWQLAWHNEEAALDWHVGRRREALARWQQLEPTTPVQFNRGMAALFLGRPAEAREALRQAVAALPEKGSWHHLAHLYLTLAEMRA